MTSIQYILIFYWLCFEINSGYVLKITRKHLFVYNNQVPKIKFSQNGFKHVLVLEFLKYDVSI